MGIAQNSKATKLEQEQQLLFLKPNLCFKFKNTRIRTTIAFVKG